ncbi:hypothetical protein D3C71_1315730 [compost metagenome]
MKRLGIVIVDDGHRMVGMHRHERSVEDSPHVEIAAGLRRLMETVVERHVEHGQLVIDEIEVALQRSHVRVPVFGNHEQVLLDGLAHMADPIPEEPGGNVLCRIEPETVDTNLLGQPSPPIFQFLIDGLVAKLDIGAHQVVEIAKLVVDLVIPFAFAIFVDEPEDTAFVRIFDAVDTAEALLIPDEFRVRAAAPGKVEACMSERLELLFLDLGAVVGIDPPDTDSLFLVGAHLVIEYHVVDHTDAVFVQDPACMFERSLVAIFGRDRSFLIEFTEIEQVVGVVTNRKSPGRTLVGWGQPDIRDADCRQTFRLLHDFFPKSASVLRVPVEELQECALHHCEPR